MWEKMTLQWTLGLLILLAAGDPAFAATLDVRLIPELSNSKVWRFEVVNASVDPLDIVRLTAVFTSGGHRLWGEPVVPSASFLQPGQAAWVSLDVSQIPRRSPVRIDWEMTWNPYSVPVLSKFLRTEQVASLVVGPTDSTAGVTERRAPRVIPLPAPY